MNYIYRIYSNQSTREAGSAVAGSSDPQLRVPRALLYLTFVILLTSSCKKFVEIDPPITQIVTESVFTDEATATSAIMGIYSEMMGFSTFSSGGDRSITLLAGLSSDEFADYSGYADQEQFYSNSLVPNNSFVYSIWSSLYKSIYYSNSVIDGLLQSKIKQEVKNQLEGEAKFIRAFCYFYLVNLFKEVPLVLKTDYRVNALLTTTPQEEVYRQAINDLIDAQNLLAPDYSYSKGERVRPNRWAARALLARIYLYQKDWENAELQSNSVIEQSALYGLSDLNGVFLKNGMEAIWQLMPTYSDFNTYEGFQFILFSQPNSVAISSSLLAAFEPGDYRKSSWVSSYSDGVDTWYYPFKYKISYGGDPLDEYSMVLRLSEQYLIRAEARANLSELAGAIADVDEIRERSGISLISITNPSISKEDLIDVILHERQVEFFSEWGHRWFDLKRSGDVGNVLSSIKSAWQATDEFYPIPQLERANNPNLGQNGGY